MWRGKKREQWDMVAVLQRTLYETGMSRPKRMPKAEDLNPFRKEDVQSQEQPDDFLSNLEAQLRQGIRHGIIK